MKCYMVIISFIEITNEQPRSVLTCDFECYGNIWLKVYKLIEVKEITMDVPVKSIIINWILFYNYNVVTVFYFKIVS